MERSDRIRGQIIGFVVSDLHGHGRGARKQRREEDFVLNDDIGTYG